MKPLPKISIVTVAFNSAKTIVRTIKSVQRQSHKNKEHIIIDGNSKDATVQLVNDHLESISYFVSEPDHGVFDAMNKGVAQATGDIIAFLNSDDYYADDDVLIDVARAFQKETLDAAYGNVDFFNAQDEERIVRRFNSANFSPSSIGWGWIPAHPALFVRTDLLRNGGGFKPEYRLAGDYEFVARIMKNPELRYLHIPRSLTRMQMGGLSTSGWRATVQLNKEVMRACRENNIPTNWVKLLSRYPAKAMEFYRKQ